MALEQESVEVNYADESTCKQCTFAKKIFFPDRIPLRLKEGRPSSDSEESVIASYTGTAVFMPHVGKP